MELIKGLGGTFGGVGTPLDQLDVPPTGPKALSTAVPHGQGLGRSLVGAMGPLGGEAGLRYSVYKRTEMGLESLERWGIVSRMRRRRGIPVRYPAVSSGNNLEGVFEGPFSMSMSMRWWHLSRAHIKWDGKVEATTSSQKSIAQQIARRKFPAGGMSN